MTFPKSVMGQNRTFMLVNNRRKSVARVDVAKTLKRKKRIVSRREADILRELRAIGETDSGIRSHPGANRLLEQYQFERFRVRKTNQIQIQESAQAGRHIGIHAGIVKKQTGIDEVRLTLDLAGTKIRQQTVG